MSPGLLILIFFFLTGKSGVILKKEKTKHYILFLLSPQKALGAFGAEREGAGGSGAVQHADERGPLLLHLQQDAGPGRLPRPGPRHGHAGGTETHVLAPMSK